MADTLKELKNDLASKSPRKLYVFHGEERYLLEYYIKELRKLSVDDGMEDFNLFELDGAGLTVDALTDAVETMPAFSEHKMVVVTDLDLYKPGAERKEPLETFLSDLPDFTTLVFVYDTVDYKTDARSKIHRILNDNALVVEFSLQEGRELVSWLRRQFSAHNKTIGHEEAQRVLFVCGHSMTLLKGEVEKLIAYSSSSAISMSDIEAVCVPTSDAVVFQLADAVSDKRFGKAIELERELLDMRGEPTVILSAFTKQVRDLLYARVAVETRKNDTWLAKNANIRSSYATRKTLELARKFTLEWCCNAVKLCVECDFELKSAPGDRSAMLETLILRIAALTR